MSWAWSVMARAQHAPSADEQALRSRPIRVIARIMTIPPQQQRVFLRSEIERWRVMMRRQGVKAE